MPDPTDADVIAASWRDPRRFEDIFARHYRSIYRYLALRVGPDEAGDLASEVFIRAFARRRRYRLDHPNALPWLFGFAANLVREHRRSHGRRARAHARLAGRLRPSIDDHEAEDATDRAAAALESPALHRALAALPEPELSTLLLAALGDLTYREIAEATGVPIGTVRSRLARARRRARELLELDRTR